MKAGMVAQIRVNPKDCLSVLEVMAVLGINPYDGRSFAQCVSLALSSMLQTMRQGGVIPEDDGFQFANRMKPFTNSRNNKTKYVMSENLYKALDGGEGQIPALTVPREQLQHQGQAIPEHIRQATLGQGFTEGGATSSAAQPLLMDDGTRELLSEEMQALYDKGALTPEEQARLTELNNLLYS